MLNIVVKLKILIKDICLFTVLSLKHLKKPVQKSNLARIDFLSRHFQAKPLGFVDFRKGFHLSGFWRPFHLELFSPKMARLGEPTKPPDDFSLIGKAAIQRFV
jgi:hypothetical protein